MQQIKVHTAGQSALCPQTPAPSAALAVFGASGDLTHRKLLPSLFQLFKSKLLSEQFYLLGIARKKFDDQQFRQTAEQAIQTSLSDTDQKQLDAFTQKLYYISGDYDDPSFYNDIKNRLSELDNTHSVDNCRLFYLAVPPAFG